MRRGARRLLVVLPFVVLALLACGDDDSVGDSCDREGQEKCDGDLLLECKGGVWTLDDDCKEKTGGTCEMNGDNGVCT